MVGKLDTNRSARKDDIETAGRHADDELMKERRNMRREVLTL
jgi:hypothetical protein